MVPFASALLVGVCLLHALPALPPVAGLPPITGIAAGMLWAPRLRWAGACMLGFVLAWLQATVLLVDRLPARMDGVDLRVTGSVVSLPDRNARGGRFTFAPDRALHPELPSQLRVAWYLDPPLPPPGSRWNLTLRLRAPRGAVNPAGFDYERWLLVHRIGATAYVRSAPPPARLEGGAGRPVLSVRARLDRTLDDTLSQREGHGVIRGLVIGERGGMRTDQWEVLARTGTSHLMAISGLHIGLVAGAVGWIVGRVLAVLRVPPWTARLAAVGAALAAAGGYAVLAGLAVPTRRAWLMLAVGAWVLSRRKSFGVYDAWACALSAVLVFDPAAVASAGFWLSFAAVFLIVWSLGHRVRRPSSFTSVWRIQWVAGLGLLPLTAWFFQQGAVVAPLANLLAVPVFSLLIVPATLMGAGLSVIAPGIGQPILGGAAELIDYAWAGLTRISTLPGSSLFTSKPPLPLVVLGMVGVLWATAPRGVPLRWVGILLVVSTLAWRPAAPGPDGFRLVMLDVGQGLATVIRTHRHVVVYDTGPSFGPESDAGARILVPYLRAQGIRRIDLLVVSHPHDDHHGGVGSLRSALPVHRMIAGDPSGPAASAMRCVQGQTWWFDGIEFRVLHPPPGWSGGVNDGSCVLEVDGPGGRVLLPGDVEWRAELSLARPGSGLRAVDLVVVPHHGSRSSSIPRFVTRLSPHWALVGVGHTNRWGFPDREVVGRWESSGAEVLDTARHGAIVVDVPAGGIAYPLTLRQAARAWWRAE